MAPRNRRPSTGSSNSECDAPAGQEMGSMYDYLAKIILLGPSGCGKSCLLHRFVKGEWRVLSSQTIGVEFASKIVKIGTGARRKRVKLQLWDTAGTERFRSVSRSYYRGAAGAILVYDLASHRSFSQLPTFLNDARALASPQLTVLLAGNKADLADPDAQQDLVPDETGSYNSKQSSYAAGSLNSSKGLGLGLGAQQKATVAPEGREVSQQLAASWASTNNVPVAVEVSALDGDNVDEVFNRLARMILTKIELGEIDPDDPMSGIQYGDAAYDGGDDVTSIKSGLTADGYTSVRRKRRRGGLGLGEWGEVFKVGRPGSRGGSRSGCC